MIGAILPPAVVVEEAVGDLSDVEVHPAERVLVARAVEKRRLEFSATRMCARRSLQRLGVPPGPVLSGRRGEPRWPTGVVGSMTHCAGYCAAAVAWRLDIRSLGIDAEPNEPLPEGLLAVIGRDEESSALAAAPAGTGVCWDRLLFSAKESVFKAWYPVTRRELDFRDAFVAFDFRSGTFDAWLSVTDSPFGPRLVGRWMCRDGHLLTSVVVPIS